MKIGVGKRQSDITSKLAAVLRIYKRLGFSHAIYKHLNEESNSQY